MEDYETDRNCKHPNLIVQRNNGARWVTCTDCHADFTRHEPDAVEAELCRVRRAVVDLWRKHQATSEDIAAWCAEALGLDFDADLADAERVVG